MKTQLSILQEPEINSVLSSHIKAIPKGALQTNFSPVGKRRPRVMYNVLFLQADVEADELLLRLYP